MTPELPPLHEDLAVLAPLSPERTRRLAAFAGGAGGHVVDVGCGWAHLLLTALELSPSAHGTGIDVDAAALAHARLLAQQRGLADRVTFVEGEGAAHASGPVDAVVSVGARHVWGADDAAALTALRSIVRTGGRVVYGDGIWSREPTAAATTALGGDPGEYGSLADVAETAVASGFRVLSVAEAGQDEWDAFESGYSAGYERWLVANPGHPEADVIRQRAHEHRSAYLRGYRGILGHAFLELVAV
ncbi:MAG TPA: class I SAM-dependent methyltransferase [Kineosporiaceae bacterium]|nr:class I SAM-dependent methyltransferase [Kineosporiaceae bacterium]